MKLHFKDQTFSFELLRATSYARHGGAELGECLATAARIHEGDFESWHVEWLRTAERVDGMAAAAFGDGHRHSAREALLRAGNYYRTAEFFLSPDDPRRLVTYRRSRETFHQAMRLLDTPVEIVHIPYEGITLPGYFYTVDDSGSRRPTIVTLGGFDSTGEELYFFVVAAALLRGYNCLAFDGPGQGELLRLHHVPTRPDYEAPVRAVVDFALQRPDVDPAQLAIWGASLGGYYAARAAAFEPRLKACVAHGAMYDLWDAQASRQPLLFKLAQRWPSVLNQDAMFDVLGRLDPYLRWASVNGMWVFGVRARSELFTAIRRYTLKDVAAKITCPTLILHGERDHFVPPQQATALHAALRCPKSLYVFNSDEGAEEHCQMGNLGRMHQVAFDWLDDVFEVARRSPPREHPPPRPATVMLPP